MGVFVSGADGKLKKVAGNYSFKENPNIDCLRTEVIYDMNSDDPEKNWGFKSGIQGGSAATGRDFSKYSKLILSVKCAYSSFTYIISLEKANDLMPNDLEGYSYSGSGQSQGATTNNHIGISTAFVSTDKTKLYHKFIGRYFIGSTNAYVESNHSASYCITNIDGVLKEPAMIYTGAELHEGNGISIKDGVISSKGFEFVGNYSATTSMMSIDIDLDNYDYLAFSSMEIDRDADIGLFFNQGLTWTIKRSGSSGGDNTLSRTYVYLRWGWAMSAVNYIKYDGSKTLVYSGDPSMTGFAYATGKPKQLTLWFASGYAKQSYITLFRRKK